MNDDKTIDLASIRARLAGTEGRQYWQSLEELADSPSFAALVQREFPAQASEWLDPKGRRGFLKLMGASIALAGATACTRQPDELLVPYVRQPEEVIPGKPLFFATAMALGGIATGLLAESHVGRPTKLEGNPEHPSSLGATDLLAQGSILTMYDPDRSRAITYLGEVRPWASFMASMQTIVGEVKALGGAGLHFLTETTTSPTLAAQLRRCWRGFLARSGTSTIRCRPTACTRAASSPLARPCTCTTSSTPRRWSSRSTPICSARARRATSATLAISRRAGACGARRPR
jgi:molybdopterin-containing oxidoreductase family iron-sulfur binding subunit